MIHSCNTSSTCWAVMAQWDFNSLAFITLPREQRLDMTNLNLCQRVTVINCRYLLKFAISLVCRHLIKRFSNGINISLRHLLVSIIKALDLWENCLKAFKIISSPIKSNISILIKYASFLFTILFILSLYVGCKKSINASLHWWWHCLLSFLFILLVAFFLRLCDFSTLVQLHQILFVHDFNALTRLWILWISKNVGL